MHLCVVVLVLLQVHGEMVFPPPANSVPAVRGSGITRSPKNAAVAELEVCGLRKEAAG